MRRGKYGDRLETIKTSKELIVDKLKNEHEVAETEGQTKLEQEKNNCIEKGTFSLPSFSCNKLHGQLLAQNPFN